MPDTVIDFQQHLICPICLDRFKQPKLLPCQHTFCLSPCLINLADKVTNRIKCPECRMIHTLPFQGVDSLPYNLTLLRFLELDLDSVPSNCFQCEKRGQNTKCPDCANFFCQNCKKIHLAHLQNEIQIKINNIRKSINSAPIKSESIHAENPIYEELKQEISNVFGILIDDLKTREKHLIHEVESYRHLAIKEEHNLTMTLSQENCAEINYFCDLTESIINKSQAANENQLARMKQQCQIYLTDLNKPKIKNESASNPNRLNFSINKFHEFKNQIQNLGSVTHISVHESIPPQNLSNQNGIQNNKQRATWNKARTSFGIDLSSTNQNNQKIQSSREIKSDTEPRPITRSETFMISTDYVENLNQPTKSVDINVLSNVKQNLRAKTPLAFNVMLNEPLNLAEEKKSWSNEIIKSNLLDSSKSKIDYQLRTKVIKIFGKQGKDNGEFNWPLDVAVNSFNNKILVTDSLNHRIQLFDQEGKFIRSFGHMGSKDGEFNCPTGIFIDNMSNIYVVDRLNHRIQIFDRYCRFLRSISSGKGNQPGQLNNPWGIAVNKISEIFVCDKENDRICVFNTAGKFLRSFGQNGYNNGYFDKPCYVHITNENKVFVSDCMNHRIQVFDTNGVFIFKFGCEGNKPGEFKLPRGISSDHEGNVLVADSGNSRIQVFRNDGCYVSEFGSKWSDPGMFRGIEGIFIEKNSNILVCDRDSNRIQIFKI